MNNNNNLDNNLNRFDNFVAALTGARFRNATITMKIKNMNFNSTIHEQRILSDKRNQNFTGDNESDLLPQKQRPRYLFTQATLNCNDNDKVAATPSSEEDNSPTELNNCKRLTDKPPLVKRLTMGLLRSREELRPLVSSATPICTATTNTCISTVTTTHGSMHLKLNTTKLNSQRTYSNGYVNEEPFEPEKLIASKFGDSCRQSLTAIPMLDTINLNENSDNNEFHLKKRYIRETSSANSSPKIFSSRLRVHQATTHRPYISNMQLSSPVCALMDAEEEDFKEAAWFQAGISREIAVEVLAKKQPGAFLVRRSTSKPGCYALTLRVPGSGVTKVANYIILRNTSGFKIKGFRKEFPTLKALIIHHSVMPELLPIPLALPRPSNITASRRNLDDFDTYDSLQMLLKYLRAKNLEDENPNS